MNEFSLKKAHISYNNINNILAWFTEGSNTYMNDDTKKFMDMLDKNLSEMMFHRYKRKNFDGIIQYKNKRLSDWQTSKKMLKNVFFAVNDFDSEFTKYTLRNGYTNYYEKIERHKYREKRFNSYYVDVDFKLDDKHLDDEALQEKKDKLYQRLMQLSLPPSAVIDSRNGFHIYYIIDKQNRMNLNYDSWELQENAIYDYFVKNVSREYTDKNAKRSSQLLRLPDTIHHKTDSKPYIVSVKYLSRTYTPQEISDMFPIFDWMDETDLLQTKQPPKRASISYNNINNNNIVLSKIVNLNIDYFDYVDKYDIQLGWNETVEYIQQYDLRKILQVDVRLNENFSSIFREDKHPSCVIFKNDEGKFYYYDFATEECYSLIGLYVQYANIEFTRAVKVLAKILGITIKNTFDNEKIEIQPMIDENIRVLEQAGDNKETKYLTRLVPLYVEIMKVWKREVSEKGFNNPADCNLQLASRYLVDKIKSKDGKTVRKYLNVLTALNILKKIESKSKNKKFGKGANTYLVQKLDADALIQEAKDLKKYIKNPLGTFTTAKMEQYILYKNGCSGWAV